MILAGSGFISQQRTKKRPWKGRAFVLGQRSCTDTNSHTESDPGRVGHSFALGCFDQNFYTCNMADSYSKIYIQIVLPVRGKQSFIQPEWEAELYKYITGAVQGEGNKMLAINGVKDHIHFFFGMKPTYTISDGIRELKKSSNQFIRNTLNVCPNFSWQPGFGAFSYGEWDIDRVIKYIQNQKEHHRKVTFKDEYHKFLDDFKVDYKEEYLFEWYDNL